MMKLTKCWTGRKVCRPVAGCLAALLMLSAGVAAGQTAPPTKIVVEDAADAEAGRRVTVGEHFRCVIPAGWHMQGASAFGLSAEEKKTFGITLDGPWQREIALRIFVFYYAPGNLVHPSVERYLRAFSQPPLGVALEGSRYGMVEPTTIAGRAGMVFERTKNEYLPLSKTIRPLDEPPGREGIVYERREMMARPVPVRERFIVLPAAVGFYALRYAAAAEDFDEFLPAFETVAAGFEAMR